MTHKTENHSCLVIFDFDGVIADSKTAYAQQMSETLNQFSDKQFTLENILSRVGNTDLRDDFKEFLETEDSEIIDSAIQTYVDLTDKYSYLRKLYPNANRILEKIHVSHFTGIVSRKPQKRMDHWLQYFNIMHLFDYPIGTIERTKSDAILRIQEKYRIPSDRTFMIGDTEFDIKSAKQAGVKSVFAFYGASEPEKVLKLNPDFIINDLEEILSILSNCEKRA